MDKKWWRIAAQRANELWKDIVQQFKSPQVEPSITEQFQAFITQKTNKGGAQPV